MSRVIALNFVAAALHGSQAIAVLGIISWMETRSQMFFSGGKFDLVRVAPVWQKKSMIQTLVMPTGQIDVMYIIFSFFMLSAVFQCAGAMLPGFARYLRFVEYSISASIMMMGIALEAGIRDVYTLQAMFVLMWATQLFGIVAEILSHFAVQIWATESGAVLATNQFQSEYHNAPPKQRRNASGPLLWLWIVPHAAGWVTCMSAYGPAIDVYLQSSSHSDQKPPVFVTALVFIELILFSCFGLVQTYVLVSKTLLCISPSHPIENGRNMPFRNSRSNLFTLETNSDRFSEAQSFDPPRLDDFYGIEIRGEYAFVILSLVAKTLLGWIIISPMIVSGGGT